MPSLHDKQKSWTQLYEDRQFSNVVQNYDINYNKQKFLLESRFKVFEDELKKVKFNSNEYNYLLDECVDLFMILNEVDASKKNEIVKYAKDAMLKDEFIDEFDGKKVKKDFWPYKGRITLRDAIDKSKIGQNSKAEYSKRAEKAFCGKKSSDNYPSPSNSK